MSSAYGRPLSPPRNRYHPPTGPPGPRTSAGSFFSTSAYDPHAASNRSSRDYIPGPRTSAERIGATRVVPIRARSPPRRAAVDDYHVGPRPRRATLEPDPQRTRRPLSMIMPSSDARRPVITSAIDKSPSPVTKVRRERRDDDYEVLPASSSSRRHHNRHSSLGTTETGRLIPLERDAREKSYRQSNSYRPAVRERQGENDRDYGFEYTDAREAKYQDPTYRQRSRRDSYNSARPASMVIPEGSYIPRSDRDAGPPVSSRGFETIERSGSLKQGYRARDDDRATMDYARDDRETSSRKTRPEIALHHPLNDGYAAEDSRHHRSRKIAPEEDKLELRPRPRKEDERLEPRARDGHDDERDRGSDERHRRHHHKHHRDHDRHRDDDREDRDRRVRDEPRDKRNKEDDSRSSNGMLAVAGAAAEGVRQHRQKESRDEENGRSARRTRDGEEEIRPSRRPRDRLREPERDPLEISSVSTGPSTTEDREYEEARQEERRARRDAEAFIGPVEPALREQASYERRPEPDYTRHHRSYQPRRHHSRTRDADSYSSLSFSSSSDSEDDKIVRQPRVVTPSPEEEVKQPPPPPKGILRKPRDRFPEHPATEREGVAPHKDQVKKNVPPGARWTKIKRELVNPESLEQDGIRFNEFPDHVIVLKVMDTEEIMKYAKKTADIRAQRRMLMAPPPPEGAGSGAEGPPAPPVSYSNNSLGREEH
ncbi:hypothetical protein ABVK25_005960 [Lepraria finkii]|uniref:DUF8035 domain-containing protein n=1 Tax=Lepraria finkii TaxID=1340010 RepID=A0ABR4B9V0_9LECA